MDSSPLTLAYDRARAASRETRHGRLAAACSAHDEAAAQYGQVVEDCHDSEALRTLRLLAEHHRKLAAAIKTKDRILAEAAQRDESEHGDTSVDESPPRVSHIRAQESPPIEQAPLSASPQARLRQRIGSPALAKDIASRRGIPSPQDRKPSGAVPGLSNINASGTMAPNRPQSTQSKGSTSMVSQPTDTQDEPRQTIDQPSNDESFARFYSAITTGPLSKLSSMLAFTGLPLIESDTKEQKAPRLDQSRARVSDKPEVEKYFSKAALQAIEAQHKRQGFSGSTFGGGESFYVIPTSGGTASYANIVSRTRSDAAAASKDVEGDVFVDARETAGQTPAVQSNAPAAGKSVREEELTLENESLKQILDKLSNRLQAFESHAQDASMAALAQSVTWNRASGQHAPGPDLEERMRAMGAQLQREMKEREALALENQKQKGIIVKYRTHWEQLKTSARAKEQAKRGTLPPSDGRPTTTT